MPPIARNTVVFRVEGRAADVPASWGMEPQEGAPTIAAAGITLRPLLRRWDELAWPHAKRGFYQFRKVIPRLVELVTGAH